MPPGLTDVRLPAVASLTETARELGAPAGLLGAGAVVAENLLTNLTAAVGAGDLPRHKHDTCVSETAATLEAVATATECGAVPSPGFVDRATALLEATTWQVSEDTRAEYQQRSSDPAPGIEASADPTTTQRPTDRE